MDTACIDSLPLIKEKVDRMIAEEMKNVPQDIKINIPKLDVIFKNNQLLRKEYTRIKSGKPMTPFDIERYKLTAPSGADLENPEAWKRAADNAAAQLEHQDIRLTNLEILNSYGTNSWKSYNQYLESLLKYYESQLEKIKEESTHINKARKYEQIEAGVKLSELETQWADYVTKNAQIKLAIAALEAEIEHLRNKSEQHD
ncbi:Pre-mRNA-splicing factor SPF27 [Zancudomyces culisetae]|uniref:Pre-mRNA-splicing factor SPF27 n=1 Tax=Zancudomyces culisetae TaxID=1213189 RepID=A0A1R1PNJ2_ZANCU|nr:Pre-mRNA-splicing factor SPF27 [Zancudomyces culisetae]OMH84131.1 Pre-mRNA-splicing factor SPF27 [Zancudomyces culisetae]|eukprot:OMH82524.1 Pre-mRNA-splicing factor SPF27 [Zancudomyces culisetae]